MVNSRVPFRQLYKESFRINPFYDFAKFEVRISFVFAILLTIVGYFATSTSTNISDLGSTVANVVSLSAFGLMGLLGFTISGLAIISGTISTQVTHRVVMKSKFKSLQAILFSFWYLGLVSGLTLTCLIIIYFVFLINLPFRVAFFELGVLVLSYAVFFCIFYAVSLLGTCIEIFKINYFYSIRGEEDVDKDDAALLDIKIQTIMSYLHRNGVIKDKIEFTIEARAVINALYPEDVRDKLLDMLERDLK